MAQPAKTCYNTPFYSQPVAMNDRLACLPILFNTLALDRLTPTQKIIVQQIDELLPQTQCGLCGHPDGCLPYAYDVAVRGESHNLCVPGGQAVTDTIGTVLAEHGDPRPTLPATTSKWTTDPATDRPAEVRAIIDENDCIGCTKCIPACPVDAIIGTAKHMHTIITDLCTGCELCLPPCPVDCIRLEVHPRTITPSERADEQAHLRTRYHRHLDRVAQSITDGTKPVVSSVESVMANVMSEQNGTPMDKDTAKNAIELAKIRTQIKKLTKQLSIKNSPATQDKLDNLTHKLRELEQ